MNITILLIIACCCIIIIAGVVLTITGATTQIMQLTGIISNTDTPTPTEIFRKPYIPPKIVTEIELTKIQKQKTTAEMETVDPTKINLVRQLSINPCVSEESYGFNSDKSGMYASNGCGGVFTYNNKIGVCIAPDKKHVNCPFNSQQGDYMGNLLGFVDPKTDLVLVKGNKQCISEENAFGLHDYNNIFVDKYCSGSFALGSLMGNCTSDESKKTLCPIGHNVDGNGLWMRKLGYIGTDTNTCYSNEPQQTYGLIDKNNMFTNNSCTGSFRFGLYHGNCASTSGETVKCPIGSKQESNGLVP